MNKPNTHYSPKVDTGLLRRVQVSLKDSGYQQVENVETDVDGDIVTLTGEVPLFYHSQIAQNLAGRVVGVGRIVNQIEVCSSD